MSKLELEIAEGVGELPSLVLLKKIYNGFPDLTKAVIDWFGPDEPSTEFIKRLKVLTQESGSPALSCSRPDKHLAITLLNDMCIFSM